MARVVFISTDSNTAIFVSLGGEYSAIVEFAPFQKVPKKKTKKTDSKKGTIEEGVLTFNNCRDTCDKCPFISAVLSSQVRLFFNTISQEDVCK